MGLSESFSFSFSSRWHRSARKGPYALRPVSQQSPQGCPRNSANICLVEHRSFSTLEGGTTAASFLHSSEEQKGYGDGTLVTVVVVVAVGRRGRDDSSSSSSSSSRSSRSGNCSGGNCGGSDSDTGDFVSSHVNFFLQPLLCTLRILSSIWPTSCYSCGLVGRVKAV